MRLSTILWSVSGVILLATGGARIMAALGDRETQILRQVRAMAEAVADHDGRSFRRFLTRDYIDESTGVDRGDLRDAFRHRSERLGVEFDSATGLDFLPAETDTEGEDHATVRVKCLILRSQDAGVPEPYWALEAVLDLRKERGNWKVRRSREVNHDERGKA